jgi:hypothetical protein
MDVSFALPSLYPSERCPIPYKIGSEIGPNMCGYFGEKNSFAENKAPFPSH